MATTYKTTRIVSAEECHQQKDLPANTTVYGCIKPTYGALGENETAVTFNPTGDYPFFGIPTKAITTK